MYNNQRPYGGYPGYNPYNTNMYPGLSGGYPTMYPGSYPTSSYPGVGTGQYPGTNYLGGGVGGYGNTGGFGSTGGFGGYGGYNGNSGLPSYFGYNNPTYTGNRNMGFGYYQGTNSFGLGQPTLTTRSTLTQQSPTGFRGYN